MSLLVGIPFGAVAVISLIANGYMCDRFNNRVLIGAQGLIVSMVGVIVIVALPRRNSVGRLIGYYLTGSSANALVSLLSLISTNVAGYTKKTTVAALYLIGVCYYFLHWPLGGLTDSNQKYCVGNIIGPQTFQAKDAPQYIPAEFTMIVCMGVCVLIQVFIWWWYKRENARKEKIRANPLYVPLENQQ